MIVHARLLNVAELVLLGQFWRSRIKRCVWLDGELIPRDMHCAAIDCVLNIPRSLCDSLSWQAMHEVNIESLKSCALNSGDRRLRLFAVMDSPEL